MLTESQNFIEENYPSTTTKRDISLYGKSWASEQKNIKNGADVIDPRFKVTLYDYWGKPEVADATPRSSDGQLLFLMEMVSKMKAVLP